MDLDLVIVAVDSLPPAVRFWRDFSDWTVVEDVQDVYAELRTPTGRRFGLYAIEHYERNLGSRIPHGPGAGSHRTELYVLVDDASSQVARAVALGAELIADVADKPWGERVGYLLTPGGIVLAIAQSTASTREDAPTQATTSPDGRATHGRSGLFSMLIIGPLSEAADEGAWPVAGPADTPAPTEAPAPLADGGVVSWFDAEEGWGAIRTDAGHDVFAHYSAIDAPGYRTLVAGQRVHLEYHPVTDQDGYRWVADAIRI